MSAKKKPSKSSKPELKFDVTVDTGGAISDMLSEDGWYQLSEHLHKQRRRVAYVHETSLTAFDRDGLTPQECIEGIRRRLDGLKRDGVKEVFVHLITESYAEAEFTVEQMQMAWYFLGFTGLPFTDRNHTYVASKIL